MALTLEQALLAAMQAELGNGEIGGNNDGPNVWRFRRWIDDDKPWCAAVVFYGFEEAAAMLQRPLPRGMKRTHSAKRLGAMVAAAGQNLRVPEPGCVYVFHRGGVGGPFGHIGVCETYDKATDTMVGIEGNKGRAPSPVARYSYPAGAWRRDLAILATTRKPVSTRKVA